MNLTAGRQAMWVIAVVVSALAHAAEAPNAPAPGKPAAIAFASHSIRNWTADGEKGIWVQANGGAWYYGAFDFPCEGLDFKLAVRVLSGPNDELDRWGGVETRESGKCRFRSFETSAGPPKAQKKVKPGSASAAPAASMPVPETNQGG